MLRSVSVIGLAILCGYSAFGQLKKFYSLNQTTDFDTVNFQFRATSGHSYLRYIPKENPLVIYGNPDLERINPSFDALVNNNTCDVSLELEEFRSSGLGDGLAFAMLNDNPKESDANYWKVLLSNEKVYNLDLHYGIGSSDINLSGAMIKTLKMRTGSADVQVTYDPEKPNLTEMDTFFVKVDLGSFRTKDLSYSNAKCIMTDILFGKAYLDFTAPMDNKCMVKANVGAGGLKVFLPRNEPVIIYLKDSPFRGLSMAKDFEEVEKNVYINKSYSVDAENLLTFDVDVALGRVSFQYAD